MMTAGLWLVIMSTLLHGKKYCYVGVQFRFYTSKLYNITRSTSEISLFA